MSANLGANTKSAPVIATDAAQSEGTRVCMGGGLSDQVAGAVCYHQHHTTITPLIPVFVYAIYYWHVSRAFERISLVEFKYNRVRAVRTPRYLWHRCSSHSSHRDIIALTITSFLH